MHSPGTGMDQSRLQQHHSHSWGRWEAQLAGTHWSRGAVLLGPGVSIHRLITQFLPQPASHPRMVLGKPLFHIFISVFTELRRFPFIQELSWTLKADFIGLRHYYFVFTASNAFVGTVSIHVYYNLCSYSAAREQTSSRYSVDESANLVNMKTRLNQISEEQKYLFLYQIWGDHFCWKHHINKIFWACFSAAP